MKWMRERLWVLATVGGVLLLQAGMTGVAFGNEPVPEIDPGSLSSALTLLCGGVLVLTGRRKRS